mmetsp:Transcript_17365/g.20443  ORF Transcript_17365/g.20443 Transcript_17365/m.20443 type:complete len:455 (-) Transcript_17365:39-1403(-)
MAGTNSNSTPLPISPLLIRKMKDKKQSKSNKQSLSSSKLTYPDSDDQVPLGVSLDDGSFRIVPKSSRSASMNNLPSNSSCNKSLSTPRMAGQSFDNSKSADSRGALNDDESVMTNNSLCGNITMNIPLQAGPLIGNLSPKQSWPHKPVLFRWSSSAGEVKLSSPSNPSVHPLDPIVINAEPVDFETSLFIGKVMIRVSNVPNTSSESQENMKEYFKNRSRTLQICIQGKFKKRICFNQVYSGQEFARPLKRMPPRRVVKWSFNFLRSRLPDSFAADLFAPLPYYIAPLILAAKVVRADVSDPPDLTDFDIMEDLSSHGVKVLRNDLITLTQEAKKGNWQVQRKSETKLKKARQQAALNAMKQRKRDLGTPRLLASQYYETDTTYTFDYYDSFFRPDSFSLDLGLKRLDLCPFLGEQPVVLSMAKTIDTGEYLWKFEMWHARSLGDDSPLFREPS